jgi:hypothetical protein
MQRGEHCSEFRGPLRQSQRHTDIQESEVFGEENLVFQLSARAKCNADEVSGFRSPIAPRTFHDIRRLRRSPLRACD